MTPCSVVSISLLTSDTYQILLRPQQPFHFEAGQYLCVVMGESDERPFSIASSPNHPDGLLELQIAAQESNPYAHQVVELAQQALQNKDIPFVINGAYGQATFKQDSDRPIILIAGGTGFSYVQSILTFYLELNQQRKVYVYWGGQNLQRLYANEMMQDLAKKHSQLSYVPVVVDVDSSTDSDKNNQTWQGHQGNVLQAVMADFESLADYDIYIAGRFEMARAARELFCQQRDAKENHLYSDAFA